MHPLIHIFLLTITWNLYDNYAKSVIFTSLSYNSLFFLSSVLRGNKMKPARSILLRRAPIKWAPIGKKVLRYEQYRIEDEARQHTVLRSFEYAALDKKKKYGGRERLENLERALDYLFTHGVVLGKIQEKIIHEVIVTFLKNMFVDDLVSNLKFLTEKYLIKELIDTLALLLPRRIGKTVSCAIIIATIAVSQPFGNVVIYNLSAAQAEEFIGLVTYV